MNDKLLRRLDAMGSYLAKLDDTLGLLGLGSVGIELYRLDQYSDLDFFLIVKKGSKATYLDSLFWLSDVYPLVYSFRNTVDGYKILFADGIYGEFAVFEEDEMENISYSEGRWIFKKSECTISNVQKTPFKSLQNNNTDYAINELLTNLLVGLQRFRRGERLAAQRLIEVHALNQLLSILPSIYIEENLGSDKFNLDRRIESRFPAFAKKLPLFVQGIENIPASAQHLLDFVIAHFDVSEAMVFEIRKYLSL
jgi:lincosamide nucleotidyltransferase B/F